MLISQWPESGLQFFSSSSFPVELTKLNNRNINKHEIWHVYIFCLLNVQRHIIFSLTLLLLVLLDDYQSHPYITYNIYQPHISRAYNKSLRNKNKLIMYYVIKTIINVEVINVCLWSLRGAR